MPFTTGFYNRTNVTHFNSVAVNTGVLNVVVTPTVVTSGVDIDVTITNLTSGNQSGINFSFDIGWGQSGVNPLPTHVWLADPSWNRDPVVTGYDDVRANYYGSRNFTSTDINRGLWSSCMVFEHTGGRAIGISTNYPATCRLRTSYSGTNCHAYINGFITGTSSAYGSVIPQDFFSSGETMNFKVWLREHSGSPVTTGVSLNLCQPYIDWCQSTFTNYRNSLRSNGRVYGFFMALGVVGNSGNPRYYGILNSGTVRPWETTTNWADIFSGLPRPEQLKAKGFDSIMFWNPAGHQPSTDFISNSLEAMPDHLINRLWQIKQWSIANNIKVYSYHGNTWTTYNTNATGWDSPQIYNQNVNSGILDVNYTFQQLRKPTINATGNDLIRRNTTNGWLVWTDGLGMDAMASLLSNPWVTGSLIEMRNKRPDGVIFSENYTDDRTSFYCLSSYYPYNQWDGLRCELANRLYGNNDAFIIINQFDYANPTTLSGRQNFVSGVLQAEAAGLVPIILCDSTAFDLLPYPSVSNNNKLDKLERRTSRRIR
jgi:hypothetical protein